MAMNLTQLGYAIILVGMFVIGASSYINSANQVQNLGLDDSQFDTLVKIAEVSGNATAAGTNIYDAGIETADTLTTFSSKGFESAKEIGRIPSTGKSLINDGFNLLNFLGIDPGFNVGVLTLITLLIGSALVAIIMKVTP